MKKLYNFIQGDKVIWLVVILLSLLSALMVFRSSGSLAYRFQDGNTWFYLLKHVIIVGMGFGVIYVVHLVKFGYFSRVSQLLMYLAVPLLLLTLVAGVNINSASRWLEIPGIGISFQTSDFAKLALIMFLARIIHKKQNSIKDFKEGFVPILLPVVLTCGLIFPADFSTAALIFGIALVIMFIGRVSLKYIGAMIGIGLVSLTLFILIADKFLDDDESRLSTWIVRIENFASGEEGEGAGNYQSDLAKSAIVTGGVFGNWFSSAKGENPLPPQAFSDFMFATVIKETGLIGGIFTIILYLILLYRSVKLAIKVKSTFAMLLVVGCSLSLVFQAFSNMAVAVGIFPVTGQPLPFVSMGGTSIWFTSISIGIILSVSREVYNSKEITNEVA